MIRSLWQRAEDAIRNIDREAKEEAARIERETSLKIEALREEHGKAVAAESGIRAEQILSEALDQVRLMRLASTRKLSARLYRLTGSSLGHLRNEEYPGIFRALAMELPPLDWTSVSVNPDDAGLARRTFPDADILPDERISGGMDVATADNRVRVINTLDKRLERAWEEILSDLLRDCHETV